MVDSVQDTIFFSFTAFVISPAVAMEFGGGWALIPIALCFIQVELEDWSNRLDKRREELCAELREQLQRAGHG